MTHAEWPSLGTGIYFPLISGVDQVKVSIQKNIIQK